MAVVKTKVTIAPTVEIQAQEWLASDDPNKPDFDTLDPDVQIAILDLQTEQAGAAKATIEAEKTAKAQAASATTSGSSTYVTNMDNANSYRGTGTVDLTAAQAAADAKRIAEAKSSVTADAPEPWVIRTRTTGTKGSGLNPASRIGAGLPTRWGTPSTTTSAPLSVYEGEYGAKVQDTQFQDWLKRRSVVLQGVDALAPTEQVLLNTGFDLWRLAGSRVASNASLKKTMTPEEWLDLRYEMAGGDAAYEAALAEAEEEKKGTNPITHTRQVSTYSVTAAQAQALVDDISQNLLGRMASDAELKRARKSMQKLLTATVTNTTTDATDPSNVQVSSHTKAGVGPDDAGKILQMRMQRGSEGMAFNMGQMFEDALTGL